MIAAVIVAGGSGLRMNSPVRKQYLVLDQVPILARTIDAFAKIPLIRQIVVVVPQADMPFCEKEILPHVPSYNSDRARIRLAPGGKERQDSVFNGIMALDQDTSLVLIHDGVRPFIPEDKIRLCMEAAKKHGAAVLGLPVTDTLKQVSQDRKVEQTLARSRFWTAQTPQAFAYGLLKTAHEQARAHGFYDTDDASLVERMGVPVVMVEGSKFNIKITTPEDLELAAFLLSKRRAGA